jgi:hypothetical protein
MKYASSHIPGFQSYHTKLIKINQPIKILLPHKSMQKDVPEATQH